MRAREHISHVLRVALQTYGGLMLLAGGTPAWGQERKGADKVRKADVGESPPQRVKGRATATVVKPLIVKWEDGDTVVEADSRHQRLVDAKGNVTIVFE